MSKVNKFGRGNLVVEEDSQDSYIDLVVNYVRFIRVLICISLELSGLQVLLSFSLPYNRKGLGTGVTARAE